jgi:Leucine-rich repeat (LRR) protein
MDVNIIARIRQEIEKAITGDGKLELYLHWPRGIPSIEEYQRLDAEQYEYSALEVDTALAAFNENDCAHIHKVSFKGARLQKMPESLKKITGLRELDLWDTGIRRLPEWIADFTHLQAFRIETCYKSLPSGFEHLTKLPELTELYLSDDHSRTITPPDCIGDCEHIQKIGFAGTTLNTLPPWVQNWRASLIAVSMSGGRFETLPEWIGNFPLLKKLGLYDSGVQELPASIGNLRELQVANLRCNPIPYLPESFSNLTQLRCLELWGLSQDYDRDLKELPEWIGNFIALEFLCIRNTNVLRLPESLAQCTALRHLDLSQTGIAELPEWVAGFSDLEHLDIAYTKIKTIPQALLDKAASGKLKLLTKSKYDDEEEE